ncbi:Dyp-type peroxidase [Nocardioides sp. CBS4Y-1]|uniref:Dyp-type peroxidase n=2 Tax=Nocardioides acrostichi TaxID=2784339 RepID=A0A930UZJ9_9ACTN|nr:Dyp-type peroxidase [Nocardioides acrostichi]
MDRRGLFRGLAGTGLAAGAAGLAAGCAHAGASARADEPATDAPDGPDRVISPYGEHQPGIAGEPGSAVSVLALDVVATDRGGLAEALKALSSRVGTLTQGYAPRPTGISGPPSDSGVLGPDVPADGLTVTVSVGASLFDHRFGLAGAKPLRLKPMHAFADDDLDAARCGGDLLLQVSADHGDTVLHAVRDLMRHTRGALAPRWRIDGARPPSRPTGAPRNHLGFKDGIANPSADDFDALVWAGDDEPAWTAGGSYHVVRIIRMLTEFWDRVGLSEQERMIGRRRDSGAPLSGSTDADDPDYSDDPRGSVTPLDSHIRLANPRTDATADQRMLRRAWNYDAGLDLAGNLDLGLVFTCFQTDLERAFETVQHRLQGEPLVDYITPVGGGYFFALPGLRDEQDRYGRGLLDT